MCKQECIPVGCVLAARRPYAGVCFRGGVCFPGGCASGGSGPGGVMSGPEGGSAPGGVSGPGGGVSQHALRQTPPPVDRMTNRCKNITLATTSLRPVTMSFFSDLLSQSVKGPLRHEKILLELVLLRYDNFNTSVLFLAQCLLVAVYVRACRCVYILCVFYIQ